ncbi:hypothetical protein LS482_13920 [Sinomicrobium kalidii]|uniref:glycoside hydrolase family 19 protein n=1 Tax=Sinomicrobium kalidii TaxID=2900738 RepID=UPI001E3554EA|nr:glycoside hydrolase family 19 protein [Sinomicrobium kalidii]UGU14789.1 hypothetical protein LS482_13920 [Sinomicrobium kalidii]
MGVITKIALGKFIRIARGDINNYADVINQSAAISINETADEGICFGEPEDPPPGDVFVMDAYFAERVVDTIETDEEGEPFSYAFNFDNTITDSNKETIAAVIVENSEEELAERNEYLRLSDVVNTLENKTYEANQDIELPTKKLKESVSFNKISSASLEKEVYIVAEHFGAVNCVQVTLKEKETMLADGGALPVLVDENEVTTIELGEPEEEELKGAYRYAKIKLRPKDDDKLKEWQEKLQEKEIVAYNDTVNQRSVSPEVFGPMSPIGMEPIYGETVRSLISIEVEAEAEGEVNYCGKDRSNTFLNEEGEWFELGVAQCYCNRDLTEEEVKEVIIALRKSESSVYTGDNKENLFWKSNCDIPSSDKSFARFTEELNSTFNTYDINTCIRKIHFLAQIYHETDRLRTSEEYNTSASYAPYIGRGLMQLTWESNYKIYGAYSGVDCVEDPEIIGNDLFNACDSAGWFWKQGKVLSEGETWSPPSSAPSYVTNVNPSYSKDIISYEDDGETKEYGTVDFNLIADDDYVDVISWLVNGGSNGLQERRDYVDELKEIFKYETDCENNR